MLQLRNLMGWWLLPGEFPFSVCCGELMGRDVELTVNSILCSDFAIKRIDEPFVLDSDDRNEWAL
jgi:hypothetical protein